MNQQNNIEYLLRKFSTGELSPRESKEFAKILKEGDNNEELNEGNFDSQYYKPYITRDPNNPNFIKVFIKILIIYRKKMRVTIQKSIIENILVHIQPFLEKKDTSQITSHVLINATDAKLTLRATDYEIGLIVSTDKVNISENGNITANGKKLLDIIRILKEGEVHLEVKNELLYISQAHSKLKRAVSILPQLIQEDWQLSTSKIRAVLNSLS